MISVRQLLEKKKKSFWIISPDATVYEAVQMMMDNDVGALMVVEGDQPLGIVTERDYARRLILQERHPKETLVRDIMSQKVMYIRPDQTIGDCMKLMTERNIRHLPVMDENSTLVGIVSIRDVVRYIISHQEFMIEQLETYITDRPTHRR